MDEWTDGWMDRWRIGLSQGGKAPDAGKD